MECLQCGESLVVGELHYCPNKPVALRIELLEVWKRIKKLWGMRNGKLCERIPPPVVGESIGGLSEHTLSVSDILGKEKNRDGN